MGSNFIWHREGRIWSEASMPLKTLNGHLIANVFAEDKYWDILGMCIVMKWFMFILYYKSCILT